MLSRERCVLGAGRNAAADCNPVWAPHVVAVLDADQTAKQLATFGGTVCRTRHGSAVLSAIFFSIEFAVDATNASSWHYSGPDGNHNQSCLRRRR